MRAALVSAWPFLSARYGIHPWDIPRLSPAELDSYLQAAADETEQIRRASRG